jgi:hypothetical protein
MNTYELYKVSNEIKAIEEELIENGGELTPELEEVLTIKREQELPKVLSNYNTLLNKFKLLSEGIDNEIVRLNNFKSTLSSSSDKLKYYILKSLFEFGEERKGVFRIEADTVRFSTRKSAKVEIDNPEEVPEEYKTYDVKISTLHKNEYDLIMNFLKDNGLEEHTSSKESISKVKIKANKDEDVPGAHIETIYNLAIK